MSHIRLCSSLRHQILLLVLGLAAAHHHARLLHGREAGDWRITLNNTAEELEHVTQVCILAHIPTLQVRNRQLIVLANPALLACNLLTQLLVKIHLRRSVWVAINQTNFDTEVLPRHVSDRNYSLKHKHICRASRLTGYSHRLNARLEARISYHKISRMLQDDLRVLTVVDILHPLAELSLDLRLVLMLIHF